MPIILSPKRKKRSKFKLNRKTYFILGTIFISLAGLAFLFFGSGVFKIENIEIRRVSEEDNRILEDIVNSYLEQGDFIKKRNNIFLVNLRDLEDNILGQIPKLKNVNLKRTSLKGLLVDTLDKEPKGIYCTDTCYYFDSEGVVYEVAPKTKGFLILNITDERDISIKLGDSVLNEGFVDSIHEADELFKNVLELGVEKYLIPSNSFDEFRAKTEEGWFVYMSTDSIKRQLGDLKLFLDNQFNKERDSLIYIDTKLEDRVYYREK